MEGLSILFMLFICAVVYKKHKVWMCEIAWKVHEVVTHRITNILSNRICSEGSIVKDTINSLSNQMDSGFVRLRKEILSGIKDHMEKSDEMLEKLDDMLAMMQKVCKVETKVYYATCLVLSTKKMYNSGDVAAQSESDAYALLITNMLTDIFPKEMTWNGKVPTLTREHVEEVICAFTQGKIQLECLELTVKI